jgi:hypothetical protein
MPLDRMVVCDLDASHDVCPQNELTPGLRLVSECRYHPATPAYRKGPPMIHVFHVESRLAVRPVSLVVVEQMLYYVLQVWHK